MPKKYLALVWTLLLLFCGASSATPITFQFKGTVKWGVVAPVGSQITGVFSYDTDTQPVNTLKGYAHYQIPAPAVISAEVAGHSIVSRLRVTIWDNYGGNVEDMVDVYGASVLVDQQFYPNGSFGFRLASRYGQTGVLDGTGLPASLNPAAFDAGFTLNYGWLQSDGSQSGQLLQFSIDSIEVVGETCPQLDPKAAKKAAKKAD